MAYRQRKKSDLGRGKNKENTGKLSLFASTRAEFLAEGDAEGRERGSQGNTQRKKKRPTKPHTGDQIKKKKGEDGFNVASH